MATKPIFFLHIPKTGGVTLRTIISCAFGTDEIFQVPDHESRNAILAGELAKKYRFVHGHFDCLFVEPIIDQLDLVTFLREPVARVCSIYHFFRQQPRDIMVDDLTRQRIEYAHRLSLSEFIEVEDPIVSGLINSGQRATLGGSLNSTVSTFARAQALLEKTVFFGLCERFEESVQLLSRTMGWPADAATPRLNVGSPRQARKELTPEIRDRIREKNQADLQLYELASAVFEERRRKMAERTHTWRQRVRDPNRFRGRQTAAGQIVDVSRAMLCSGWLNLEGSETTRPWRFAGPGLEPTVYAVIDPEPGAELWALFHLPFFIPGLSAENIVLRLNSQPCQMGRFAVTQGAIIWLRAPSTQLLADGLQRVTLECQAAGFDSSKVETGDDRPIRFAFTQALFMQFDAKVHVRFAGRLAQLFAAMASPQEAAPLVEIGEGMTAQFVAEGLRQPALSNGVPWCTPQYQHRRLSLLEDALPRDLPPDAVTSLHQLYLADPGVLCEILMIFFPHIAQTRTASPA